MARAAVFHISTMLLSLLILVAGLTNAADAIRASKNCVRVFDLCADRCSHVRPDVSWCIEKCERKRVNCIRDNTTTSTTR